MNNLISAEPSVVRTEEECKVRITEVKLADNKNNEPYALVRFAFTNPAMEPDKPVDSAPHLSDSRFNESLDQMYAIRSELTDTKQLLSDKLYELIGYGIPESPEKASRCAEGIIARTLECQSECRMLVSDIYDLIQLL